MRTSRRISALPLEEAARVFFLEREELAGVVSWVVVGVGWGVVPGRATDLGEREHDAPDLALVAEAVFADDFELGVAGSGQNTIDVGGASSRPVAGFGLTYRRADSNAGVFVSGWLEMWVRLMGLGNGSLGACWEEGGGCTYVAVGPCRSWSTCVCGVFSECFNYEGSVYRTYGAMLTCTQYPDACDILGGC